MSSFPEEGPHTDKWNDDPVFSWRHHVASLVYKVWTHNSGDSEMATLAPHYFNGAYNALEQYIIDGECDFADHDIGDTYLCYTKNKSFLIVNSINRSKNYHIDSIRRNVASFARSFRKELYGHE